VAAGPAAKADVVKRAQLVELDGLVRAALRTDASTVSLAVHRDTFQSVERAVKRVPRDGGRRLYNTRSGERDRGPVGALDAANVVVIGGVDVTSASGTLLEQDQVKLLPRPVRRMTVGAFEIILTA
jgi:hypothetical protein